MTAANQTQLAQAQSVPLDTVVFSPSAGMRSEYARIGEIPPVLRPDRKHHRGPVNAWYLMTVAEANDLWASDEARSRGASGGLKTTYRAHLRNLELAIDAAGKRQAQLGSGESFCLVQNDDGREEWICTKKGVYDRFGIKAVPGDSGAPQRAVRTIDNRGCRVAVTRWWLASIWPQFFRVRVLDSLEAQATMAAVEQAARARATRTAAIKRMPQTVEAFRESVENYWRTVGILAMNEMQQAIGFRYSEAALLEFRARIEDVADLIKFRRVVGVAPAVALQRELAAEAKADSGLQAMLASIKAAAGRGVEGGAA